MMKVTCIYIIFIGHMDKFYIRFCMLTVKLVKIPGVVFECLLPILIYRNKLLMISFFIYRLYTILDAVENFIVMNTFIQLQKIMKNIPTNIPILVMKFALALIVHLIKNI